jgi:hypothetical protein
MQSRESTFLERRKNERFAMCGPAQIRAGAGAMPREVRVTDISDGGVRLLAEGVDVPQYFTLYILGSKTPARECRVVWRLGSEIGAEFCDRLAKGYARRIAAPEPAKV